MVLGGACQTEYRLRMQIVESGRWVRIAQWVLAVLLPVFVVVGRGLVGAELGWMAVVGIVYGAPLILLLLLPPIATLFDRTAKAARSVRRHYRTACWVQWGGLLLAGLTIPDSGDSGHLLSALSRWTGLSYEVSEVLFYAAMAAALIGWAFGLAAAGSGAFLSRKEA